VKRISTLAALVFASCGAVALGQNSPAPDRPAEGPLRANPGTTAPGVHPPSPMDGNRFAPGPPPPMPGTVETPPGGRVKTEEKVATPGPTAAATRVVSPGASVATTPTAAPASKTTPARTATASGRKAKKGAPRASTPAADSGSAPPRSTPASPPK
jgi:general secretion pathway protein B